MARPRFNFQRGHFRDCTIEVLGEATEAAANVLKVARRHFLCFFRLTKLLINLRHRLHGQLDWMVFGKKAGGLDYGTGGADDLSRLRVFRGSEVQSLSRWTDEIQRLQIDAPILGREFKDG
jgi:hypothetical protein